MPMCAGLALCRARMVERIDTDQWRVPDDLLRRAAGRDRQVSARVLSPGRSRQADRIGQRDMAGRAIDPWRNGRPCVGRLRPAGARGHGPAARASYRTG